MMPTFVENSSRRHFISNLWKFVDDPSCNDLIAWSDSGLSFIVYDQAGFARDVLPKYFKHKSMANFIRQLHNYGFRKVPNYDKAGMQNECEEVEYQHENFCRDDISLLEFIQIAPRNKSSPMLKAKDVLMEAKDVLMDPTLDEEEQENDNDILLKLKMENALLRHESESLMKKHEAQKQIIQKIAKINGLDAASVKSNANCILIDSIKKKLKDTENVILSMKQQNELLWRELANIRQKDKSQEQILQKFLHFLGAILQGLNQNLGAQRNIPCMQSESCESKGKSQAICTTDVLQNKKQNFISAAPSKLVSILKPVIHAVTDFKHNQEDNNLSQTCKLHEEGCETSADAPENVCQEMESPLISSLNSHINKIDRIGPLRISKSLYHSSPCLDDMVSEMPVINLPVEHITTDLACDAEANDSPCCTSILETPTDDVIPLSKIHHSLSHDIDPKNVDVYTSSKSDIENFMQSPEAAEIPTFHIKDFCLSSSSASTESEIRNDVTKHCDASTPLNELKYQLAIVDNSSIIPSTLMVNALSSPLLSDEDLNMLQEMVISWNIDTSKLLGPQIDTEREPDNVVGNELVHFMPSVLKNDPGSQQLLEHLSQDQRFPVRSFLDKNSEEQKNILPADKFNTNQELISEACGNLTNNKSSKFKSPCYSNIQKSRRAKRRKMND